MVINDFIGKWVGAAALICLLAPAVARAQDNGAPAEQEPKRVAVIPLGNKDGTETAREHTAVALRKFLEKRGCRVIEGESVRKAFEEAAGETPGMKDKLISLNERELLKVGRALNVDYVVALNLKWHTKSIYVFPTLRTKADCVADGMIIDVAKSEVALDRRNVRADSENKNMASAVAAAFTYLGAGAVSGGPKTPPQTIAGVKAVYADLEDFLKPPTSPRKIDLAEARRDGAADREKDRVAEVTRDADKDKTSDRDRGAEKDNGKDRVPATEKNAEKSAEKNKER